ncbi:piggyBac transposable element-derived protein 3-like [Xenia sp. Carnegie-2017]|uniref:piggyBac transposable element-derived protein 3-like n=1 Tax=Xenia sp. Carnegie-2017 TaxID=2897299 RepID=UPI001F035063|nr:piggyBac transposable element-derived protein 3-like [Xenia sp. Carnegie-2017]
MERQHFDAHNVLDILDCDNSDAGDSDSSSDNECWEQIQLKALLIGEYSGSSDDDGKFENVSGEIDDSDDNDDNMPLASIRTSKPSWRKTSFVVSETSVTFTGPNIEAPVNMETKTPLQYFKQFVSDDMLQNLLTSTNEYSVQKSGNSINTNKKEIEQLICMFFHMGLVRMWNGVRQYWESATAYSPVCDVMSRNQFQLLLRMLHFVNNLLVSDNDKRDKLWKIRPWLEKMRENCLKLIPEEHNSIDEMMCKYRGRTSPIRQYIKSKPHPWGFKVWCRAGDSGILYDFDAYQGGNGKRSQLGQGADVVLKLTSTFLNVPEEPKRRNIKLIFHDFARDFSTGELIVN